MNIRFTKHAERKFDDLSQLGIHITKSQIVRIIRHPIDRDIIIDQPNVIASGTLDQFHILRVVYHVDDAIITVVTFYPAKKGRYTV